MRLTRIAQLFILLAGKRTSAAEDRLQVVAVWIQNEGGVVAGRITSGRVAQPRWTVVGPARLKGRRVESVNFCAAFCCESSMLSHAMGVVAVNPEHRIVDPIAYAIHSLVLGNLRDPAQPERTQNYIVKGGGTDDVCNTDARVID